METRDHAIEIIGFAKQIGDIAEGAKGVAEFFALATLLTARPCTGIAARCC